MDLSYACAREEAQRIRSEEGPALFSIRYFANVREVRLLVITDRVQSRTFEFTPKIRQGPSLKVIRANPQEWESKRLELVPSEWRNEPAIVLTVEAEDSGLGVLGQSDTSDMAIQTSTVEVCTPPFRNGSILRR